MSDSESAAGFAGFPGIAKATAIPNSFFSVVLPEMRSPGELLAFLWVARLAQEQRGDARFVTANEVRTAPGAAAAFAALASGPEAIERGLQACVELGALISLELAGAGRREAIYFVNNPASRRAAIRAQAGELQLRPATTAIEAPPEGRPGIFRLYEEHVGTITPMVGERLLSAAERFPQQWIEEAFREAAELNARNWRYIERILERWSEEGRGHEATGRDSADGRGRRYVGDDALGSISRSR